MWEYQGKFGGILSLPQNTATNLNNVMVPMRVRLGIVNH